MVLMKKTVLLVNKGQLEINGLNIFQGLELFLMFRGLMIYWHCLRVGGDVFCL